MAAAAPPASGGEVDPEHPEFTRPQLPARRAAAAQPPAAPPVERGTIPPAELRYTVPDWSACSTASECRLEVLRGGVIIGQHDLCGRPFHVVGRDPRADIPLEHPSISRQHAVIQLRANGAVYVYDLGSTHGTFWNKTNRLKSETYVPLQQGDMLHFGNSTRCLVLCGGAETPEEVDRRREAAFRKRQQKQAAAAAAAPPGPAQLQQVRRQRAAAQLAEAERLQPEFATWGDQEIDPASSGDEAAPAASAVRAVDPDMAERFDDTDEFYDRTASARRRAQQQQGGGGGRKVITETAVRREVERIEQEVSRLEERLRELRQKPAAQEDGMDVEDTLETYMAQEQARDVRSDIASAEAQLREQRRELEQQQQLLARVAPALAGLRKRPRPAPVAAAAADTQPQLQQQRRSQQPGQRMHKVAKVHPVAPGGTGDAMRRMLGMEQHRLDAGPAAAGGELQEVPVVSAGTAEELRRAVGAAKQAERRAADEAAVRTVTVTRELPASTRPPASASPVPQPPLTSKGPAAAPSPPAEPAAAAAGAPVAAVGTPAAAAEEPTAGSKRAARAAELMQKKARLDAFRRRQERAGGCDGGGAVWQEPQEQRGVGNTLLNSRMGY
eukprot:TRINITY_DN7953_c0_g2_i2.p1 TRINITY_DN7953_c0_g2~~TRINITY_DN7953_c0_g2_i2.p1  ORF type:complete len:643 (+),score=186.99 TRINITY_DN7953_c0_g2_i2:92-1930(+)